jgi:hypothetical protein
MSLLDPILGQTASTHLDAGLVMRILQTHPGRQKFIWFKSWFNPVVDQMTKETPPEGKRIYVPQNGSFSGIFDIHRTSRTYRDTFGSLDESSTTLLYIPDESYLAEGDHVLPWGVRGDGSDVAVKSQHQVVVRGGNKTPGTGRMTVVNSTRIDFTLPQELVVGDVIWYLGQSSVVLAVVSPTRVTVAGATPTTNLTWELGRDWIDAIYPKRIEGILIPNGSGGYSEITSINNPIYGEVGQNPGTLTDPGVGTKRCWVGWQVSPTQLVVGTPYSIRVEAMPLYRVSEGGIQLPGWDYQSIYHKLASEVITSPRSLPVMATLTLVVR